MWSREENEPCLVRRDDIVKHVTPDAEADEISCNSSSEADEACAGDAGPDRAQCGTKRNGEGMSIATFRRIR